ALAFLLLALPPQTTAESTELVAFHDEEALCLLRELESQKAQRQEKVCEPAFRPDLDIPIRIMSFDYVSWRDPLVKPLRWLPLKDLLTQKTVERISVGMTAQEVYDILGWPTFSDELFFTNSWVSRPFDGWADGQRLVIVQYSSNHVESVEVIGCTTSEG